MRPLNCKAPLHRAWWFLISFIFLSVFASSSFLLPSVFPPFLSVPSLSSLSLSQSVHHIMLIFPSMCNRWRSDKNIWLLIFIKPCFWGRFLQLAPITFLISHIAVFMEEDTDLHFQAAVQMLSLKGIFCTYPTNPNNRLLSGLTSRELLLYFLYLGNEVNLITGELLELGALQKIQIVMQWWIQDCSHGALKLEIGEGQNIYLKKQLWPSSSFWLSLFLPQPPEGVW